jgi:hypothetical protein
MIELSPLKAPKPLVSSAGCRTRCDGHPEPRLKRGAKDARVFVGGPRERQRSGPWGE